MLWKDHENKGQNRALAIVIVGLLIIAAAVITVDQTGKDRTDDAADKVRRQVSSEVLQTFQRQQTRKLREGCERRRIADRRGAKSWRAHRDYLEGVLGAASVMGDVKKLADTALKEHRKTVRVLKRFAAIDCAAKYPLPGEQSPAT